MIPELDTDRLRLRAWREEDLAPFARMNADPRVMAFFPSPLTRAESDTLVARIRAHFVRHGFGAWAVELQSSGELIGLVGLSVPTFRAHFTPCVEVAWRLAADHWRKGYATEAAAAALAFGFETAGLDEIVSFTVAANEPSRRVMERLGMTRAPADDFAHPQLPPGHGLAPHVLYRLTRADWKKQRSQG